MDRTFEDLSKDPDIVNIMNKVASKYQNSVDPDDVESIKLQTLWKCQKEYNKDKKTKFTTYLFNQLGYAFKTELKKSKKSMNVGEYSGGIIDTDNYYQDAKDMVTGLPEGVSKILEQRYLYNMTMVEIGNANGYSRETARRRLQNAIKICKKKHRELI